MDEEFSRFIEEERQSRDTIDVKRLYIDMADDLLAGILLSQIIFWYLPSDDGSDKLRIEHDGYQWIANTREEWWKQVRLKSRQFDRAVGILESKQLIFKKIYKFRGSPTTHLRLNFSVLYDAKEEVTVKSISPIREKEITDPLFSSSESVKSSITENTSKTTNIDKAVKKPPSKKGRKKPPDGSTQDLAVKWCSHVGIKIETLVWQDWVALKAMSKAEIGIDTLIEMSKKAWAKKKHNLTYLNNERASLLVGIQESESESKNGRRFGSHLDLIEKENQKA